MCGCWRFAVVLISWMNRSAPRTGGEFGTEDFHRDRAVVFEIVCEVDRRHAAFAKVAFDPVAVGEGGREEGGVLRHQAKMDCWWGFGEWGRGGPRTEC